jgi:hypothetical protein
MKEAALPRAGKNYLPPQVPVDVNACLLSIDKRGNHNARLQSSRYPSSVERGNYDPNTRNCIHWSLVPNSPSIDCAKL